MNPREVVAEIEKRDYKATTRTLQTYVNKNLVPEPKRSGGGRGRRDPGWWWFQGNVAPCIELCAEYRAGW